MILWSTSWRARIPAICLSTRKCCRFFLSCHTVFPPCGSTWLLTCMVLASDFLAHTTASSSGQSVGPGTEVLCLFPRSNWNMLQYFLCFSFRPGPSQWRLACEKERRSPFDPTAFLPFLLVCIYCLPCGSFLALPSHTPSTGKEERFAFTFENPVGHDQSRLKKQAGHEESRLEEGRPLSGPLLHVPTSSSHFVSFKDW